MKEIPLTQGKVARVDDLDFARLSKFKWTFHREHRSEYAIRCVPNTGPGPRQRMLKMHREILDVRPDEIVDHRDGDGLNCQRYNLRIASAETNGGNRRKLKPGRSRFKGVRPSRGKWRAYICHKGIRNLGTFCSEEAAAKEYDRAARIAWGEFARLNFPQ
jgi:hypothetical protein